MRAKLWVRLKTNMELVFPLSIAIFAAVLAMNDLFAGRYGSDELQLSNQRNNAYQWYQSKGIKETMLEGQQELLESLLMSGAVAPGSVHTVEEFVKESKERIDRYKKEKKEILIGSKSLSMNEWIQDLDGEKGKIVGAKEFDNFLLDLGEAGDFFDIASMLLQMCLVIGAIGIIVNRDSIKRHFLKLTLGTGLTGTLFFSQALWLANQVAY